MCVHVKTWPISSSGHTLAGLNFGAAARANTGAFACVCGHTRASLWETLFQEQDRSRETQRSLVGIAPHPSLSLSVRLGLSTPAHTELVLYQPFYCRLQPPFHPHFHFYPIFHIVSMLILVPNGERSRVMSFIVMQLVVPALAFWFPSVKS